MSDNFRLFSVDQEVFFDKIISQTEFQKTFRAHEGTNPHVFTVDSSDMEYQRSSGIRFQPAYTYDNAPQPNVVVVGKDWAPDEYIVTEQHPIWLTDGQKKPRLQGLYRIMLP